MNMRAADARHSATSALAQHAIGDSGLTGDLRREQGGDVQPDRTVRCSGLGAAQPGVVTSGGAGDERSVVGSSPGGADLQIVGGQFQLLHRKIV